MCMFVSPKMQKLVKAAREGTKDGLEKTKAAVKKGRSFIKTKSFCNGMSSLKDTLPHSPYSSSSAHDESVLMWKFQHFMDRAAFFCPFSMMVGWFHGSLFKKMLLLLSLFNLFREEVSLFWGWGVRTVYWGGLFQCWASTVPSTRGSFTATGTKHSTRTSIYITCYCMNLLWKTVGLLFFLYSWWEDVY